MERSLIMMAGAVDHGKRKKGFKDMGIDMSEEQINDLLKHIDEDKSGHVSFDEFLAYSNDTVKKKTEEAAKEQEKIELETQKQLEKEIADRKKSRGGGKSAPG